MLAYYNISNHSHINPAVLIMALALCRIQIIRDRVPQLCARKCRQFYMTDHEQLDQQRPLLGGFEQRQYFKERVNETYYSLDVSS
jgi:hypothetical protein